ncbi:hypothetical protein MBOT_04090 [Mycobacterium botniense]|uniref:Uncharacterized protein n=1 Tax=Mycobacterium botniense TaxID=84962 RepID=A0A7I9XSW1_9MYCO|nr:hypothetical protein MBOT_04090 [Mycobacterium botniense]
MLEHTTVAVHTGEPVVTERDSGQTPSRLGGIHDSGQAGEGEIAAQNPVRAAPGEGGDEFASTSHLSTVTHRGRSAERSP